MKRNFLTTTNVISQENLQDALYNNDSNFLKKLLLENKANIEANDYNDPPLYTAVRENHPDIVKLLLENKADIEAWNFEDDTPLHIAVRENHPDMVKLLLENKANIEADGQDEFPSLDHAVAHGYTTIVELLLKNGANIIMNPDVPNMVLYNAVSDGYLDIAKLLLLENKLDIDRLNEDNNNALHMAVRENHPDMVKLLLENKADMEIKDFGGETPLHIAVNKGNSDIVKLLLENKSSIKAKDEYGDNSLDLATDRRDKDLMKLLFKQDKEIGWDEKLYITLNSQSTSESLPSVLQKVTYLLNAGARPNASVNKHKLFYIVLTKYNSTFVELFVQFGAEINPSSDDYELTPLTTVILANRQDSIDYLINNGAKVNPINKKLFSTPLSAAMCSKNHEVILRLLDLKADLKPTNSITQPIECIKHDTHETVINRIINHHQINKKDLIALITPVHKMNSQDLDDLLLEKILHLDKTLDPTAIQLFKLFSVNAKPVLRIFYKLSETTDVKKLIDQFAIDLSNKGDVIATIQASLSAHHKVLSQYLVTKGGSDFVDLINKQENHENFIKTLLFQGIKIEFKYNNFVLTSQTYGDESHKPTNTPDIKTKSKTYFQDGKIYFNKNNELVENGKGLYVLDKKGTLYFCHFNNVSIIDGCDSTVHHSYFIKGKPSKDLYGIGRPIASGGKLRIKDGKIIEIDNESGHYFPNTDQLKLATYYLMKQNVVDDALACLSYSYQNEHFDISQIQSLNIGEILDHYSDLTY